MTLADELERDAARAYREHTDNHPTIHCNRFAAWDELSQKDKEPWLAGARERLTALRTKEAPADNPPTTEPEGWLHLYTTETGETIRVLQKTDADPWGKPGRDYDAAYKHEAVPLFRAALAALPSREAK